jgi:serine/threonine-protein kinase
MGGPIEPVANETASSRAPRWEPAAAALPSYPVGPASPALAPVAGSPRVAASTRVAGEVVGGRYRLQRQLGGGSEIESWAAEHVELGRPVVLKFVSSSDGGVTEQLLQQARVLAKIRHPHVAEFSDFGRTDAGVPFFVMEFLAGRTLQQILDERGGMAWARAVALVMQVGEALAAGHAQGVVHRDLRPANVFLVDTGQPGDFIKLLDFGLASDPDPRRISAASAGYASPEQAAGGLLDPRSDVYSLGCLLFALIAGDPPFVGTAEQVLWAHVNTPPKSLRERAPKQYIPEELQGILTRALEKLPARRYTDTRELVAALGQFARLAAAASHSGSPIVQPEPQASRSQVMGFAGRPAPKDVDELDRSLRPITQSQPVVQRKSMSPLAIVGIALGVALVVGGAGIGVFMLVKMLIGGDAAAEVEGVREPAASEAATPAPSSAPSAAVSNEATPRASESSASPEPAAPAEAAAGAGAPAAAPSSPSPSAAPSKSSTSAAKRGAAPSEPTPSEPVPSEPVPSEPVPSEPVPTVEPESKANDQIGHKDLLDPWG